MVKHDNIFDDGKKRRKLLASCCPNLPTINTFIQKGSYIYFENP